MNPAVYTRTVLPHKALAPYIKYYGIRTFDTNGRVFPKAVIAEDEIVISFFLKGVLHGFDANTRSGYTYRSQNYIECYITCLQTFTKGFVLFKGHMVILCIHFTPTGFYNIFGISPKELIDVHGETSPYLGREFDLLYEEMVEADNISKSISIIQAYLLKKLFMRKVCYRHLAIKAAAEQLIRQRGLYTISKLANDFNMSQQTLEVQFMNQVGIDPKTFCRLIRFKQAVELKKYKPSLTWTNIAHDCGFYDQMHMIKDFKNFTDLSPNAFMKVIQPPLENFIDDR